MLLLNKPAALDIGSESAVERSWVEWLPGREIEIGENKLGDRFSRTALAIGQRQESSLDEFEIG